MSLGVGVGPQGGDPAVQPGTALAESLVDCVVRTGDVPVEGHRHVEDDFCHPLMVCAVAGEHISVVADSVIAI